MTKNTMTYYGNISEFLGLSLRDSVAQVVGDRVGDYDVAGLVVAYRQAVTALLSRHRVHLFGEKLYAPVPFAENLDEVVSDAIMDADNEALYARFERRLPTA